MATSGLLKRLNLGNALIIAMPGNVAWHFIETGDVALQRLYTYLYQILYTANMETNLEKNPETTYVIKFQDCDPLGHLNNVRYLDLFLNAREEHTMQHYALNLMQLLKEHRTAWVVTNHQIAYIRPADHGKTVRLQTRIIHFDNSTIIIESLMLNQDRTKLKSVLWTTYRYISMETGRPTDHSDDLMDLLEQLDMDEIDYDPDGFQERIRTISKQLKGENGDNNFSF